MSHQQPVGGCPYCHVQFKSPGALANHLKAKHENKTLPYKSMKRKKNLVGISSDDDGEISDETDAQENTTLNLALGFCEFAVQPESDSDRVELIPYETTALSDVAGTTSVGLQRFPAHLEAGKQITLHNLPKLDLTKCFYPFRNAMDYKLARYFYFAHVPLTNIDEFFKEGFYQPQDGGDPTKSQVSFNSAYTLCKLWDEMT